MAQAREKGGQEPQGPDYAPTIANNCPHYGTCKTLPPPPPLRKHQPGQESDGQTGSWCLDKAVQLRDARYQKKACPKNLPIPHPKHNSRNRALEHNV